MSIDRLKSSESREHEPTSKIALRFFRHSIKEDAPEKSDLEISLTPEGKILARGQSSADTNVAQSVAFGSPRVRTQETAGFIMAGRRDDVTGTESLEELRAKVDAGLKHGSKIAISEALNFTIDTSTAFGTMFHEAFRQGRYIPFLVNESDASAKALHDTANDTYSRMASRIALLVKKYVMIAPRFDAIATDTSKRYTDTMERFFGTHQGVAESFLAKVIEQQKGVEERDRFVTAIGNKGFDFTEGFAMEIQSFQGQSPKMHLTYRKEKDGQTAFVFDEDVPMETIDRIIAGGNV